MEWDESKNVMVIFYQIPDVNPALTTVWTQRFHVNDTLWTDETALNLRKSTLKWSNLGIQSVHKRPQVLRTLIKK